STSAPTQSTRAARVDQVNVEPSLLKLTRDPPPTGRRLDRDRRQLPAPLTRPFAQPLTRRLEAALAQLARIRIEHGRLKNTLVNIDSCIQHLFSGLPSSQKIGREPNAAPEAPSTTSPSGLRVLLGARRSHVRFEP